MTQSTKKLRQAKKSAERALEEGQNAIEQSVEAGQAKVRETGESLREARDSFRKEASGQIEDLRRGAKRKFGQAVDATQSRIGDARKSLGDLGNDVGTYVRDHPAAALSIASAIGLLGGLLLARRAGTE